MRFGAGSASEGTAVAVRVTFKFLLAHPAHFLALGFGAGLSPKAPGTVGTLVAFPLFWLLAETPFYWAWIAVFLAVGVWACGVAGRNLGVHDHGGLVWDEVAAFLMVLPFAPAQPVRLRPGLRPVPPVRHLEAVSHRLAGCPGGGGLGVMLDDVLAAGYSILCLLGVSAWM
jgi:phosphatidylglycerophosphatase A